MRAEVCVDRMWNDVHCKVIFTTVKYAVIFILFSLLWRFDKHALKFQFSIFIKHAIRIYEYNEQHYRKFVYEYTHVCRCEFFTADLKQRNEYISFFT